MNPASPDPPTPPEQTGLILQPGAGLATLPHGNSPALSEIINRSLVHLHTSKSLATRHREPGEERDFEIAPGVMMKMCWIPPGEFVMGSPEDEAGHEDDEKQHRVTINQGFWLGKYQVTQEQWETVMGSNPSGFKGANLPVDSVSWSDISRRGGFLATVNRFVAPEGRFFIPTEAQWEYACRAGTTTSLNSGNDLTSDAGTCQNLDEVAWYCKNSGVMTHPGGLKKGNAWGLYDMHGNLSEWCEDWYGDYRTEPLSDPRGPDSGSMRVMRGGGWSCDVAGCRSASRGWDRPDISAFLYVGVRVARSSGESGHEDACEIISLPSTGLVSLQDGRTPARSEIISRSLAHTQAINVLSASESHAGAEREFEIAPGARIVMCWIPPGEFLMGSPEDEVGREDNETQHLVTITRGFWLAKTLTTQEQWEAVMGYNPCVGGIKGDLPTVNVNWIDICGDKTRSEGFIDAANKMASVNERFDLPTEAQWEYACRAGNTGALPGDLDELAWYSKVTEGPFFFGSKVGEHQVAQKRPNPWGLHDMHGNVWEWCKDWYGDYSDCEVVNPLGPDSGSYRVLRGGSRFDGARRCRFAYRLREEPHVDSALFGFRLARSSSTCPASGGENEAQQTRLGNGLHYE